METTISAQQRRGTFAQKLRAELVARGMGVRTLARALDPDHIERQRRNVNKWLRGTVPTQSSRDAVTDALGLERGSLDDDEEDDPAMRALRVHVEGLVGALVQAVREAR